MEEIPVQPLTTSTPQNAVQKPVQTPPPIEPQSVKKPFLSKTIIAVFIIVIMFILLPAGTYLFLNSNRKTACTTEAKICPDGSSVGRAGPKCEFSKCPVAPIPIPDPITDWKTFDGDGFNFKFPSNFKVEERDKNYFAIVPMQNNTLAPTQGIFADARLSNGLENFQLATTNAKNNLTGIKESPLDNGIKISGVIGPGFGEGQLVIKALLQYRGGTLSVETSDSTIGEAFFDQILSTFKFIDSTCKPRPACLDATPRCLIPETSDMCPATVTPTQ